ncbi:MAG: ABC transporter substrate-binding protein [Holophaga sp.]|nr:ABC transporter substrate-binding protein [Holophaga sp.]
MQRLVLVLLLALPALLGAGGPARVVSQTVGTDDLLVALAAPGQIAALSHLARDPRYSPSPKTNARFPCLRNGEAEDILRFRPDLVLVASYTLPETVVLLRRARVEMLVVDHFNTLDELYGTTRRLGRALGRPARAEELIQAWQARARALAARLKGCKPVRVLAVGLYPFTAGSGTTFQDLCDHAGAVNVAAEEGLKGHAPTPNEKLLRWQVDMLVAPAEPGLDLQAKLKDLAPYKFMAAFRQGHLVQLPGALMASTSQSRLDAYEFLARALHPEAFK